MYVDLALYNNIVLILAAFVMVLAALSDAMRFRIPNLACLILMVMFLLFGLTSATPIPWLEHLQVFALILGVGYILYLKKWAGAGDVKLIAAIGLWAGPSLWGPFLFITAISGGILALGIGALAFFKGRASSPKGKHAWTKTPIPYGVAIALGGLCTLALLSHPELLARS
ncbi:MAG TPA: peptidase A24 [Rhodospirillaceae bacterium]|nr:peptidase A24 [Rhodospirillaceae bacterium]